jgi:hypothetical protein
MPLAGIAFAKPERHFKGRLGFFKNGTPEAARFSSVSAKCGNINPIIVDILNFV